METASRCCVLSVSMNEESPCLIPYPANPTQGPNPPPSAARGRTTTAILRFDCRPEVELHRGVRLWLGYWSVALFANIEWLFHWLDCYDHRANCRMGRNHPAPGYDSAGDYIAVQALRPAAPRLRDAHRRSCFDLFQSAHLVSLLRRRRICQCASWSRWWVHWCRTQ